MRILIIGGVAAGASAAAKARRTNEDAEIIIFEKGSYVSFANCGLPYYVGGTIPQRENLILVTPELFKTRFNIDVRIKSEVLSVNPEQKTISVSYPDGIKNEAYDKLILATGGTPVIPSLPGVDADNVFPVFTVPDADNIVHAIDQKAKSAVVIGGGFIGLETAEELAHRGIEVTLIEAQNQLLPNFDPEFSLPAEDELKRLGIHILLNNRLTSLKTDEKNHVTAVNTETSCIPTDIVIMAIGVKPNLKLAANAGIKTGEAGGIVVDAGMRTSIPDIYAAGDIVESPHLVSRKKVRIPLAGSANKQGRIAGCNAAGGNMRFRGVLGTSIIKIGELTCGRTGLCEKECIKTGIHYDTVYLYSSSNASYYPDSDSMIIKVTYEQITGRLLGAQAEGRKGIDKRIDVYATAIYSGLTVFDLENLDLAYAPPYASAKDPVIMSGMVASNAICGICPTVSPVDIEAKAQQENAILLDVRTEEEFAAGSLQGAINIPVDSLRERLNELDIKAQYFVYCGVGYRAYISCRILLQHGYHAANVSGGYWTNKMDLS